MVPAGSGLCRPSEHSHNHDGLGKGPQGCRRPVGKVSKADFYLLHQKLYPACKGRCLSSASYWLLLTAQAIAVMNARSIGFADSGLEAMHA